MKKRKKLPSWTFREPEWHQFMPEQTGLPFPIWVDVRGDKHVKNLRYIRMEWHSECELADTVVMMIEKDPYVPGWPFKTIIVDKSLIAVVREFVIKNRKILVDVGLGTIGIHGFERKLAESVSGE